MRDPGLQPERTALAWQRTGVASLLVGAGAAAAAVHRADLLLALPALLALALAAATAVPSRRPVAPDPRLVRAAAATTALAVAGLLVALT